MHFNSDDTAGFLEKLVFQQFWKKNVFILNYQLIFLQSGRFSGKMNWIRAQLDLAVYPVFLKLESHLKIEVHTCT